MYVYTHIIYAGMSQMIDKRSGHTDEQTGHGEKPARNRGSGPLMMESSSVRPLAVVFISLLVDLLGFTVILPLMPSILEYYSHHDQVGV